MMYRSPFRAKSRQTTEYKKKGSWKLGYHTGVDRVCDTDRILVACTDGVIIRVYETSAHSGDVTMTLPVEGIKVFSCNMMEVDEAEIPVDGNSFNFTIKPFEVTTFRVKI